MNKKTDAKNVVHSVVEAIEATYGSLGFLSFRLHSLKQNSKENIFVIRYSFIPRDKESNRLYYKAKVDIKTNNLFQIEEIKKEELAEE